MKVKYTYSRDYAQYTDEEDSLEDAVARAASDIDCNTAYPEKIEALDGSFSYERGKPFKWDGPLDSLMESFREAEN